MVCVCEQSRDEWCTVRGPHGFGEMNSSGKELLDFLAMNNATICNTWHNKRKSQTNLATSLVTEMALH